MGFPRSAALPARAAVLLVAALLAACGDAEAPPPSPETTAEILRARTQGLTFLQQDRLEEARAEFARLAELAPRQAAGPANLALVALREGRLEAALERSGEALERAPEDPAVLLQRAAILDALGREDQAREARAEALALDPGNLQALWALAGGSSDDPDFDPPADREARLTRVVEEAPGSLPARFELVEFHLSRGEAGAAAVRLEEIRSLVPGFPLDGEARFDEALAAARAGDAAAAAGPAARLHQVMRLDPRYQAGLDRVRGPLGEATGLAVLEFSYQLRLDVPDEAAVLEALRFREAGDFAQLTGVAAGDGTSGDLDGDGDDDLVLWRTAGDGAGVRLLRNELGRFVDAGPAGLGDLAGVRDVRLADVDGDGFVDLYLVREGENRLYRNGGGWDFRDASAGSGAAADGAGRTALFVDLDHDADLDLVLADAGGLRVFRNDATGRFSRVAGDMGVGELPGIRSLAFADVDDDGDVDLLAARGGEGITVILNDRQDRLRAVAGGEVGIALDGPAHQVLPGDVDNDGFPDLVVLGPGQAPTVWRGGPDGRFAALEAGVPDAGGAAGRLLDFDNDGYLDLALSGPGGLRLLHNAGGGAFRDLTDDLLASGPAAGAGPRRPAAVLDYNDDGDLDLLTASPAGVGILRNDGGNLNHHVTLNLTALGPGSGKVNRFAVGSLVELRAGDLYQARTVRGQRVHFGLGSRLKADVIRIVWTNGVPQYLYFPGTDQELIESQELKGSCAFVYAWNGEAFEFVTDATWKSALGMPLGIMGGTVNGTDRVYAPAASSKEYVRIPGDALRPRDGRYTLQITEELWEVAYMDEVKLLAVDHPDSVAFFVDEKFVPPADPRLTLYRVPRRIPPASAVDHRGRDLSAALAASDHVYVSDFRASPYQGLTEPHAMVLEVPAGVADAPDPHLFLQGWIFPSDASINVAVAQREDVAVRPSSLAVPDGRGGWRTVVADIGFPSGKNKVVVVPLAGVLDPDDPRIRIATNTQVYWDHAFFAAGGIRGPSVDADAEGAAAVLGQGGDAADAGSPGPGDLRLTLLRPVSADLHYRGFSREYRKGGRFGPHWFDYQEVSEENPWLPIRGRYTRYGDVRPLLLSSDSRSVVMAPGDEMTVDFDAGIPDPPEGWTRTFLLYTDGWIKDADMNTATGHTVEPLPFQAMDAYPYGPDASFPSTPEVRAWLEDYQTRVVDGSVRGLADGRIRGPEDGPRR